MRLANALSERVNQLVTANGQVGEARLLLMAGLLMADDLHSERAKSAADGAAAKPESTSDDGAGSDAVQQAYDYVADVFEQLSDRLEAVVSTLEGSEDAADDETNR